MSVSVQEVLDVAAGSGVSVRATQQHVFGVVNIVAINPFQFFNDLPKKANSKRSLLLGVKPALRTSTRKL